MRGLLAALDGRFVPPGPAGAPGRGRIDVLPTGRNLYSIDPRAVPTRTAWEIGRRTAEALLIRHAQDHGEWPRRIVLDIWGSSTMRTGGDDLAQAFALLGVQAPMGHRFQPRGGLRHPAAGGVEPAPGRCDLAHLRPVPRRFPQPDRSVRRCRARGRRAGRGSGRQPTRRQRQVRIGRHRQSPVRRGTREPMGLACRILLADGDWSDRDELGAAYLHATSHAYGARSDGIPARRDFRDRVAQADAFVHVQDMPGQDVLDADAFAEHEAGFAAAAAPSATIPPLYHADTTDPDRSRIRHHARGSRAGAAGAGDQPALARRPDAPRLPRGPRKSPRPSTISLPMPL